MKQVEAIRQAAGAMSNGEITFSLMKLGYSREDAAKITKRFAREKEGVRTLRLILRISIGVILVLGGIATIFADGGAGFGLGWAVMIIALGVAVLSDFVSFGLSN